MRFCKIGWIVVMLMVVSCGKSELTIDMTSTESQEKSISAILESLPKEKRETFQSAVLTIVIRGGLKQISENKTSDETKKRLHGKTADEVIALAKAIDGEKKPAPAKRKPSQ